MKRERIGESHHSYKSWILSIVHLPATQTPARAPMHIYKSWILLVNSAFASNPDTCKSTNAYLGTIGGNALVNWISKGQNIVTLLSTELEYVSLSNGSKETKFVKNLLKEICHVNQISLQMIIPEPFFYLGSNRLDPKLNT